MRKRLLLLGLLAAAVAGTLLFLETRSRRAAQRAEREGEAPAEATAAPKTAPVPLPAGEEAPEAKAEGILHGRVLAEGKPLAGATVLWIDEDEECKEATTGGDGAFEFRGAGKFRLGASHPDRAPASQQVLLTPGETRTVDVELAASASLSILVVEEADDKPVPGAQVLLYQATVPDRLPFSNKLPEVKEGAGMARILSVLEANDILSVQAGEPLLRIAPAATDASGRVRLTGLPPDARAEVIVLEGDHVPARARGLAVGPDECVVRLGRGGSLLVLAPFVDGRAAQGYSCVVLRKGGFPLPVGVGSVDAKGEALLAVLPEGQFDVVVSPKAPALLFARPGEDQERPIARQEVTIESGKRTLLDLRTTSGTRIEGELRAEEKESVTILLLGLGARRGTLVQQAVTDESGRFRFEAVPPGEYRVIGARPESASLSIDVKIAPGAEVVTVLLEAGTASITGVVRMGAGTPVEGVRIFGEHAGKAPHGPPAGILDLFETMAFSADPEESGEFAVTGLRAGTYRLLAGKGGVVDVVTITLRDADTARVELLLDGSRQSRLTVALQDSEGKPCKGRVTVLGESGGLMESLVSIDEEVPEMVEPQERFTFRLPPGRYRIGAAAAGFAPLPPALLDLRADRDLTLKMVAGRAVVIRLETAAGPASGREVGLWTEEGMPLGATQSLLEISLGKGESKTGADGRFHFAEVAPGRYEVRADGRPVGNILVADTPVEATFRVE